MLSMYSDSVHVYRALQAGAAGYIAKKSVAKEVLDAIRMVREGRHHIAEKLSPSPKTVETYRARMMQKLGINDFASLI